MGEEIEIIDEKEFAKQFGEVVEKLFKLMAENKSYHPMAFILAFLLVSQVYVKHADLVDLFLIKYAAKQILKEIKKALKHKKTKQHI